MTIGLCQVWVQDSNTTGHRQGAAHGFTVSVINRAPCHPEAHYQFSVHHPKLTVNLGSLSVIVDM